MKQVFFLLIFTFCMPLGGWAQGAKPAGALVKKLQTVLGKRLRKAVMASRKEYRSLLLRHPYDAQRVQTYIRQAIVQVVNVADGSFHSSGFVFEEFFKGKRSLWVAVPYHTSGSAGEKVYVRFFDEQGHPFVKDFTVEQGGGWGINSLDVSLIKLPEELWGKVFALRLSDLGAKTGETAQVYGFMCAFKERCFPDIYARKITDVTGFRVTGDYQLPPAPSGFCGAPVIGRGGYVLGMHCGSEKGKQTFAVSANGIKELLRYFYFGRASQPVKILGKTVFEIEPFQSLGGVSLERAGRLLERVDMDHFKAPFTYARVEKIFVTSHVQPGDVVVFEVVSHGRVDKVIEYQVRK